MKNYSAASLGPSNGRVKDASVRRHGCCDDQSYER
jgi:hypothetical protein